MCRIPECPSPSRSRLAVGGQEFPVEVALWIREVEFTARRQFGGKIVRTRPGAFRTSEKLPVEVAQRSSLAEPSPANGRVATRVVASRAGAALRGEQDLGGA